MKLTLKIKLLPNATQKASLLNTLKEANTQCNVISNVAWERKVFNQFKLHKECYHNIRETSKLSAQLVVRCISKVADAYKIDKKVKRLFNDYGAIAYDSRILSYKNNQVSIWSLDGRLKIPFKCHNEKYIPYIKGEADLVFKNDKLFLFQTVEIPEEDIDDVEDFIGVDFGINKLVVASNGYEYDGKQLKKYKEKKRKVRASI
jgi:putative transposase